jgi:hypothetical protein
MAHAGAIPPAIQALAAELCGDPVDPADPLVDELARWLVSSNAFRAFAEVHRGKIRKKLRGASDAESRRDVRAELAVARSLLTERGAELAFEAYGSQQLGPDFTLTLGSARVNVEVTRLRRNPSEAALAGALLGKLRQFPPSAPNVLVFAVAGSAPTVDAIGSAVRTVRARADAKDDAFFARRGLDSTRGFWDRFLRLGALAVWSETSDGPERIGVWVNGSARIAVPPRVLRAVERALAGR